METTEDDARIAKLATMLLAEQDRPDLKVTPEQVVRWRQVADAIPVSGPRRGGRGQRAHYLPTAPAAAAALAVALDADRNLDRAVLAAFGTGAPIAEAGVRSAAGHVLRQAEEKFRGAFRLLDTQRSAIPRSKRVPLRHSREAGSSVVVDAILAPLLGEEPLAGRDATALALEELVGEAAEVMTQDYRRRAEFVMGRMSFGALRKLARHVDVARWQEACGWVRATLEWGAALDEVVTLTGQDRSALGVVAPLGSLSRLAHRSADQYASGYQATIMGLIAALVTWRPRRLRAARETVETMAESTPHLRAVARLAADLPERWRPVLGGAGAAYMATLPDAEREELAATIRAWRDAHPVWAKALPLPGRSALASSDGTT